MPRKSTKRASGYGPSGAPADAGRESSVSHQCGIGRGRQVVYRVQDDPAKAEAMLAEWGM